LKQVNLFGELQETEKPEPLRKQKFKTMQQIHGTNNNEICKTCIHAKSIEFAKVYWKCELWKLSHSSATDIRLKNTACGRWEQK